MDYRDARIVCRMYIIYDYHHRAIRRRCRHCLEKRIRNPQRHQLRRPLHRLRHARKRLENLRADPRQLAQSFRVRAANRPLRRQLLHELPEDRKRQLPFRIIRLRARNDGAFHLTSRRERIDQRRLADAGVTGHDDDAWALPPGLEPGVVQHAELALASDEGLGLKPTVGALRGITGRGGPTRRAATVTEQIGHADQLGARLCPELVGELGFIARKRLKRATPITRPRPRLHDPTNALLRDRIEILDARGVSLDRGEITDPARGIHLAHETIANLRNQTRAMLVLPVLERACLGNLDTIEAGTVDAHVAIGQMVGVDVDPPRCQTYSRTLNHHRLARDLRLDDRETLSERVIGMAWRRFGPQEVGEIVA